MCPSASSASRSVATMGSPLRLPLVITRGVSSSCMSRCCRGVAGSMMPISGKSPATFMAMGEPGLRSSSTMGRAGLSSRLASRSLTFACARAMSRSRTMTASGLLGRRLRVRRRPTAPSLQASHARCQPPSPLIASTSPACSRCAAHPMIASDSSRVRCCLSSCNVPSSSRVQVSGEVSGWTVAGEAPLVETVLTPRGTSPATVVPASHCVASRASIK